jgi:starch-binding outer membrane protein, SusD/RagB family
MKKILFKILFLLVVVAVISSCNKYLDPGYDEFLAKDEVFSSYNYSLNYARTIYSYLPSDAYGETYMTDETKHSDDGSAYTIMNNGSWDSRTYLEGWTWGHYYAGIRRIHIFLDNVNTAIFVDPNTLKLTPAVNDTLRKQFSAEAKFLRAFYYFELLKRFGDPSINSGVPIVPEKILTINDPLDFARNTYQECVDYIVKDCDDAAKVLPNRQYSSDYGKASKAAALALKSRLLLYAASPLANPSGDIEKWKLAAEAAKVVLELQGGYKLIDKTTVQGNNMLSVFTEPNNNEVLFSSPVIQSNDFEKNNLPPSFGGRGQINPTQDLVDAFETVLGYPITNPSSGYSPLNPYYRRDKRLQYFIVVNGSTIGKTTVDSYVGGKDGLSSLIGATKTGYYIRKFMDPNADIINNRTVATHFWVHFRYAEMLLNYAEAIAEAYGIEAKPGGYTLSAYDAYKLIRDRAGLYTQAAYTKALPVNEFIERIRNERRVELCFEGHRFWDVRRWKQGEKYFNTSVQGMKITNSTPTLTYEVFKVEDRVFDSKMNAMPIPYSEIQKSKLLIQNSGW